MLECILEFLLWQLLELEKDFRNSSGTLSDNDEMGHI